VDNTRDYARVSHSRQWSNYNTETLDKYIMCDTYRPTYHVINDYAGGGRKQQAVDICP